MKSALVATTLLTSLVLFGGHASAADPVGEYAHDWSGIYIGLGGGGLWASDRASSGCGVVTDINDEEEDYYANLCDAISDGRVDTYDINDGPNDGIEDVPTLVLDDDSEYLAFLTEDQSSDLSGWFGGGQIGMNHQNGRFVFGMELGAYKTSGIENSYSASFDYFDDDDGSDLEDYEGSGEANFTSELDWLTKATVRLGTTFMDDGRGLAYVVGGGAMASVSASASGSFDDDSCDEPCRAYNDGDDFYQFGFVVGGGLEYALTDSVSLGAEYNYIKLYGGQELSTNYTANDAAVWTYEYDAGFDDLHMAVVKLNYRFN